MALITTQDYRSFIREKINENRNIRGYQARLSEAAGVHSSYISRVINGHVHLTTDQAANLAEFWRLDLEEADYFVDLVLLERSSSRVLKARIEQRLSSMRRNRERLNRRFTSAHSPEGQDLMTVYYSAWYFSAIHMLLTIPGFRTTRSVATRLGLPEELVQSALESLQKVGLVEWTSPHWRTTQKDLHVPDHKMWARIQHSHWRQKTSLKIQEFDPEATHYSGAHTMSRADALKLKHLLIQFLDEARKTIAPSPEEELFFLGCDFYKV